ncbi:hypothetical protein [Paenibacillus turpanensis]|uniref:hypothetical protein n=1 Tax=Paenibacillus turpanensis TaxID=2689078 RepID=UPI00140A8C7F|nr:hypothetical protein [Paenibacillus turpanensis]
MNANGHLISAALSIFFIILIFLVLAALFIGGIQALWGKVSGVSGPRQERNTKDSGGWGLGSWLTWVIYLLVGIVFFGIMDLVFIQAFTTHTMMGFRGGLGLANVLFVQVIDFLFYSLTVLFLLTLLAGIAMLFVRAIQKYFPDRF